MKPLSPLTPSHITATVGAGYSLGALMHLICDPGDGVISPGPLWSLYFLSLTMELLY